MMETAHFLDSGLREKVIEHLFVGDLLRRLWRQGVRDIEVLRAEVDRIGYHRPTIDDVATALFGGALRPAA